MVLAEDLRGRDLVVPVGLGEVAVAAREAQAVLVTERAQRLQPGDVERRRRVGARERVARVAVELDVLDPARLQELEDALEPRRRSSSARAG